jgi:hypothetical protein
MEYNISVGIWIKEGEREIIPNPLQNVCPYFLIYLLSVSSVQIWHSAMIRISFL